MKTLTGLIASVLLAAPAFASEVGVSISVGEPGFYGRLDVGDAPPPLLIYPEPVVIVPAREIGPPIYMRVPPGHAMHWKDHCAAYGACSRRVFFVQDGWYNEVYVPHYRKEHGHGHGHGHDKGKHGKGHDNED